jgi:hypothetical protein
MRRTRIAASHGSLARRIDSVKTIAACGDERRESGERESAEMRLEGAVN